ncbi:hypothetical protein EV07_1795 [Prochlorococcus sp. MIT 0603]|nr:hypothetical protein EV07_1795 [Prochlorococcus sp. MIT 0603]
MSLQTIAYFFSETVGAGARSQSASAKYSGGVSTIKGASEFDMYIITVFWSSCNQP